MHMIPVRIMKILLFGLAISPNLGIDIELISSEIDGKLVEGNTVIFTASMKNNRASTGSGQFCVNDQCGPFVNVPPQTLMARII